MKRGLIWLPLALPVLGYALGMAPTPWRVLAWPLLLLIGLGWDATARSQPWLDGLAFLAAAGVAFLILPEAKTFAGIGALTGIAFAVALGVATGLVQQQRDDLLVPFRSENPAFRAATLILFTLAVVLGVAVMLALTTGIHGGAMETVFFSVVVTVAYSLSAVVALGAGECDSAVALSAGRLGCAGRERMTVRLSLKNVVSSAIIANHEWRLTVDRPQVRHRRAN